MSYKTFPLSERLSLLLSANDFVGVHALLDIDLNIAQEACQTWRDIGTDYLELLQIGGDQAEISTTWQQIEAFREKILTNLLRETAKHD